MRTFRISIDRRSLAGLPSFTIMRTARTQLFQLIRHWRPLALVLALLLGAQAPALFAKPQHDAMPKGQRHESRREIDQLEQAWRNAILKADTAAMSSLLSDDYIAITPSGTLQTKEEALASLRSGATRITSLEISDRRVRFYGTTALVTSKAEVSGSNAAGNISGPYRYTRVYVRNAQGKWKIVSFEASRVREQDEQK